MIIYNGNDDDIVVEFDSRWLYPECFGYTLADSEYHALRGMWEKATGRNAIEVDPWNGIGS